MQLNLILTDTVGSLPWLTVRDHHVFVELNYVCVGAGSAKAFVPLHVLSPLRLFPASRAASAQQRGRHPSLTPQVSAVVASL